MTSSRRRVDRTGAYGFPSDLDRHPLLAWMGSDWVSFVTRSLLAEFRKQDAGTEMLAITCEGAPELETRAREGSGAVTMVELRLPLQLDLRDSSGRNWQIRGVARFIGQELTRPGPQTQTVAFDIQSTKRIPAARTAISEPGLTVPGPDGGQARLVEVLRDARSLLSRPENDFSWSSWEDAHQAVEEIDGLIRRLPSGSVPYDEIAVLFAPTGPIHEVSVSSGWSEEFLSLADRFEAVVEDDRPQHPDELASQASFVCSVCGEQAGTIYLYGPAGRAMVRREGFTGVLSQPVAPAAFDQLRTALDAGDPGSIFDLEPEFVPSYCPTCRASYCGYHWDRWDVFDEEMPDWHDSIRGRCPQGHQRMLED